MSFNVLVVDDSPLARKIVVKTLRMSGLPLGKLHEASNGREALELLEKTWVDVVFADINMPEMDGSQMIERMAAHELLSSIPVIVISSDHSQKRIEFMQQLGVRAYLTKPLTPETVAAVVRSQLLGGGEP